MQAKALKQRKILSMECVCPTTFWLTEERCNTQLERASRKIADWHNKLRQAAEPGRTQAEKEEKKKKGKKLLLQLFKAPQKWLSYGVAELSTGFISRQSPKKEQLLVCAEDTISLSSPALLVFFCFAVVRRDTCWRSSPHCFQPTSLLP